MESATDETGEPKSLKRLRWAISVGALAVAAVHVAWPTLAVDAATLVLIGVAILPWLAPFVKSVEVAGVGKVEFPDLQKVASRAETAGLLAPEPLSARGAFSFQSVVERDPNLALAGLRIELERRLSQLARAYGLDQERPMGIGQLLRALMRIEVLTGEERSILADMTNMLNTAVHGAEVDSRAAGWAIEVGPRLLASLDERIAEAPGSGESV